MVLTAFTACIAMMTTVAGYFGMNLNSYIQEEPVWFNLVTCEWTRAGGCRAGVVRGEGFRTSSSGAGRTGAASQETRGQLADRRPPSPLPAPPPAGVTTFGSLTLFAVFVGIMYWKGMLSI